MIVGEGHDWKYSEFDADFGPDVTKMKYVLLECNRCKIAYMMGMSPPVKSCGQVLLDNMQAVHDE